jgi:hypothetical protein
MYRKAAAALIIIGFASTAGAQSMLECSQLENQQERLECYDEVAGRVEEKLEKERTGTTEERVESRNEDVTEEIVGAKPSEVIPDVMTVEIAKIIRDRSRRVVYKTADGRYFRRSSSSRITFREGDTCVIEDGMFGSMFLVREDGQKNKVEELSVK